MLEAKKVKFRFAVGSQHLYGPEALEQVAANAREIVGGLNDSGALGYELVLGPVLTTPEDIRRFMLEANADDECAGVITWMHTFSPSKMWIGGLSVLKKPLLHFATQHNRDIPWDTIDMDFMNLNQAAHGDREHGHIHARMGVRRSVVFGHWQDRAVQERIGAWMRTAAAWAESRTLKVARFGDNMRQVAVTEGDKVAAEIVFGWSVNTWGVGDLAERVNAASEADVKRLLEEYQSRYDIVADTEEKREAIAYQARIELGLRSFLEEGGFTAFTTTFEDLHGLRQLPGLAVQRLMEDGYGFAGEGDWKTAALVRLMKVMAGNKGTSFMEDYTYHLEPGNELVLGAHMLEVCPTIAAERPRIEVHPLGIGGKEPPARLVFNGRAGAAINASIVDLGDRFRLLVSEVEAVAVERPMPKLPVARVLWRVLPNLRDGVESWILAGGAHHTGFSYHVTAAQMADFAEMAGIESVIIGKDTRPDALRRELAIADLAWKLRK
ncbi:MAG: L-arabinose isomerase [Thermobacillus sp. ZCTH02-B1]|uniref:L-arabinose isomerase n=1 Tax=Thermobacillus sp. ZCTH02-B1 TaxID=1858795 RepID=UPI000B56DCFB|nr:L-arabinose isomerase [Thermobacillus sp. ZCTH02-B1]OUM95337.1 MAG: L-arabinose isomerase [Thermobacillus sp. ZCTH02-B1]